MTPHPLNDRLERLPAAARDESLSRLKQLAGLVVQRKVQFLCGAGMSKGSGLPLASDLAAMMVGEMLEGQRPLPPYSEDLKALAARYPLEAIAEAYIKKTDKPRLRDFIAEELGCAPGGLHEGHRALEYLASQGYIDRVYTTNFDDLIEKAFGERGRAVIDKNADALHEARTKNQIPVFHLHGTVDSECLIAESVTYFLDTPLARFMMADMVTSWFVWVGYSLTDPDLRTMYLSMQELLRRGGLAKRPYVIYPLVSDEELQKLEWRLADKIWEARGATYIPGQAEYFLPALCLEVRRARAENLARALVMKKGGDPDNSLEVGQVWKDARALAQEIGTGDEVDAMEALAERHGVERW